MDRARAVEVATLYPDALFKEGFGTGGSTGYGLYLIKKLTEVYGMAQETGDPGRGATFTITILGTNQNGKES